MKSYQDFKELLDFANIKPSFIDSVYAAPLIPVL